MTAAPIRNRLVKRWEPARPAMLEVAIEAPMKTNITKRVAAVPRASGTMSVAQVCMVECMKA